MRVGHLWASGSPSRSWAHTEPSFFTCVLYAQSQVVPHIDTHTHTHIYMLSRAELCPHSLHIKVLTPSISEDDLPWRQGLHRVSQLRWP